MSSRLILVSPTKTLTVTALPPLRRRLSFPSPNPIAKTKAFLSHALSTSHHLFASNTQTNTFHSSPSSSLAQRRVLASGAQPRMDASSALPATTTHHHESNVVEAIERKLSPGILLIIAILAMVFFLIGLLNLLIQSLLRLRRARRRRRRVGSDGDGASPTALQGQLGQLFHLHDAGVDQAFIDTLPVFAYRAVAGRRKDDGPFDCAVCLCEFDADDKLRLLPTCGHAFHVPCIDAWLLAHSTCPLCRRSILAECSPECASPFVFGLDSFESVLHEMEVRDLGDVENEESQKGEEIVEVKLGKLRCVDGSVSGRDFAAVDGMSSTSNGGGDLGQRRCLSMGSYEYVTDENAALRVAVKATPKKKSRSRRRHALSECDFGGSKKGAWEAAVTNQAAASADAGGGAARSLKKDSFSVSKIWMVPSKKEHDAAGERRAMSFRWPVSSKREECSNDDEKKKAMSEAEFDVEAGGSCGNSVCSLAEERPSFARRTLLWVVGGGRHNRVGSCS